jgi:regulatory protein
VKISDISLQAHDPNRVNVSVDGKYSFSLDISQVTELGVRVDKEYDEAEIELFKREGEFGKLYARSLEYALMRPHSEKEMKDYLWRKTRDSFVRSRKTGEIRKREGVSQTMVGRVLEKLIEKNYVNDKQFTRFWVENRMRTKGVSQRRLVAELRAKGISTDVIEEIMQNSTRDEKSELQKMIAKKKGRYEDEQKLMLYLVRQGFSYQDVKSALASDDS